MRTKLSADPAYIPRSARATEFKVTLSTTAAEHSADRLEFLQAQAQQAKEAYESALRTIVSECIDLKIEALKHSEKTSSVNHSMPSRPPLACSTTRPATNTSGPQTW